MNTLSKILVCGIMAVACAGPASATLLYWQVIDAQTSTLSVKDNEAGFTVEHIDSVRLMVKSGSGDSAVIQTITTHYGQYGGDYSCDESGFALNAGNSLDALFADITGFDSTEYSFAIELGHYNESGPDKFTSLADSSYFSYDSLAAYVYQNELAGGSPIAWTPSAYAAPEPTSALLFLTGLSLMALRRRKVV